MAIPGREIIEWLTPLGLSVRLAIGALSPQSFKNLSWAQIREQSRWMGLESFYLVAVSAVVVAIALLIQVVIELHKYHIHDFAGGIISVGLLREIGPLTIGLAWAGRVAARISDDAHDYVDLGQNNEITFAQNFILPRYMAACMVALPLATYGLVIGFLTAAFMAPLLSVSSTNIFFDSARDMVEHKDVVVFFTKIVLAFPFVAVMAGSACGILKYRTRQSVAIDAVTATFMSGFAANLVVTFLMYYR